MIIDGIRPRALRTRLALVGLVALLIAVILIMSGCASRQERTSDDRFIVKDIGGSHCVMWLPARWNATGAQMECVR